MLPYNGPVELLPVVSSFCYAITLVILRRAMIAGTPLAALITVNSIVSLGGFVIAALRGTLLEVELTPFLWFAITGFLGQGIGTITHYTGIERMGVSRSTAIQSSTPLWGTAIAVLVLGEDPSGSTLLGTIAIVTGVMLLAVVEGGKGAGLRGWLQGAVIFPVISSLTYALVPVFAKLAFVHQNAPFLGYGVAFGAGSLTMLAGRRLLPGGGRIEAEGWGYRLFAIAGVFNFFGATVYWYALTIGDVSIILPISRLYPLFVLVLSAAFLGKLERITARLVFAASLIVAGGVLVTALR